MKKIVLFALCAVAASLCALSAAKTPEPKPLAELAPAIRLWEGPAPAALGDSDEDIPAITPYLLGPLSDGKGRPCVIVCPGGGYSARTVHEGDFYAHWLNELGISAFVLRYRLGSHGYRHPTMLGDVARAVRFVRTHAKTYGVDPQKIGVIGSSAGGHLVSTILTHFDAGDPNAADPVDRASSRPDLGILLYPVITMQSDFTHRGSCKQLLGENPDPALIELLSNERQVKDDTPPSFLVHSMRDKTVPVQNSLEFAAALDKHKVPFELHVYDLGGHGFGLGTHRRWEPENRHPWVKECERWLAQLGFVPEKAKK